MSSIHPKVSRRKFLSGTLSAGFVSGMKLPAQDLDPALKTLAYSPAGPDLEAEGTSWGDQGILDLRSSPYAKLRNIPIRAVAIDEGFWSKRRAITVSSSIPRMRSLLEAHGRMDNFRRLIGKSDAPRTGRKACDSDVYKWIEAVSFSFQSKDSQEQRSYVDEVVADIKACQEPGGYLNTYFVGDYVAERMTPSNQGTGHELYCIGHLIQASVAYYRATGNPILLEIGQRFIDGFLLPSYGPDLSKKPIVSGHPEIEMALVELYRATGSRRYLDLAGYILHGDERIPLTPQQTANLFCGIPFTSRTKLEGGHAVRVMYACCGATDYYLETGDPATLEALNTLWTDLSERQMYVTGGVGALSAGESFGDDYELPNKRAYCESCAAIGSMMWNWRMLAATGDARYTDIIERALYNGINSGMSLDGKTYCYRNPLAFDILSDSRDRHSPAGKMRNPWYDTTCCPPNLERTMTSLPGYFYSTSKDGLYVHLYDNSELRWRLESGLAIQLKQKTNYPWDGDVSLHVAASTPDTFTIYVRIPGWSKTSSVRVNGKPINGATSGRYLPIRRKWTGNDVIDLHFDMEPQIIRANPAVAADTGRIALQRGPVVYCMEQLDQADQHPERFPLYAAYAKGKTSSHYESSLLDGVVVMTQPGTISSQRQPEALYQAAIAEQDSLKPAALKLIPYYAWANRDSTSMLVWIPEVVA